MADIRALMAQERQARRISHEFASYLKAGALICTACQLNIKSETLWDGHLRSANHKANVKRLHDAPRTAVKRKIEDVEATQASEDVDTRKKLKPKPRSASGTPNEAESTVELPASKTATDERVEEVLPEVQPRSMQPKELEQLSATVDNPGPAPISQAQVDEEEWAAFERDVAPLAQADYSTATITAAPVTAAQLQAEADSDRKRLRDAEIDDEKEDESRRIEEEFEVMEEMEDRVRKLREKREALRSLSQHKISSNEPEQQSLPDDISISNGNEKDLIDDSDDDDEDDDWYS